MSAIYCSQCGTKHGIGSKFCTNCGNSLGGFVNTAKNNNNIHIPQKNNLLNNKSNLDEDGIPTVFVKPSKLSYDIESSNNNKYSAKDLLTATPLQESEKRNPTKISNYKKLTREEFMAQSIKECSSRSVTDIDET